MTATLALLSVPLLGLSFSASVLLLGLQHTVQQDKESRHGL